MDKLKKLIAKSKCGIHLSVDEHKQYYETVEQHFDSMPNPQEELEDIDDETFNEMKARDTIVDLQVYHQNADSFLKIYHYDVDKAIDEALEYIES